MTCLWEAVCCQITQFCFLEKKKKSLPVSPPDISPAGMEIWVRLNRFVFGVVAPR